MNRAKIYTAGILVAVGSFSTSVLAADQTVTLSLASLDRESREAEIGIAGGVPAESVGKLPGIAFRVCWEPANAVATSQVTPVLAAPPTGFRWIGSAASLRECATTPGAVGLPMSWIDEAAAWPAAASVSLATLGLSIRQDFFGEVRFFVDAISLAPDHDLASNEIVIAFLPPEIFSNGFEGSPL